MKHITTIAVLLIIMVLPYHMNFISLNKDSAFTVCAEEIYTVTARAGLRVRDNPGRGERLQGIYPLVPKFRCWKKVIKKKQYPAFRVTGCVSSGMIKQAGYSAGFLHQVIQTKRMQIIILIPLLEKSW